LLLLFGEIHFHEDQVFLRVGLEFLIRENLLLDLDAPAAPVGAGEIDQDGLVLFLGLLLGGFVIMQPAGDSAAMAAVEIATRDATVMRKRFMISFVRS
jgi:hypothetical protein